MPAEAGIQFEEVMKKILNISPIETLLDSRFRGNDGLFFITTQSLKGERISISFQKGYHFPPRGDGKGYFSPHVGGE
jgi:hypothetical protein